MKANFILFFLLIFVIACSSEKKEKHAFKRMTFSIYPPVLPPDQNCITEVFEIEDNTLKYTKLESLCGENKPKSKTQKAVLSKEQTENIKNILIKLQPKKFSNDSKYDGNASANLQIEWEGSKENFSFLSYEGEEITKLYTTLRAIIKEVK